jgi:hypothetical protein
VETIPHVTYRYEVYLQDECACFWQVAQPMGAFSRGDFLTPRTFHTSEWPALDALVHRREMMQIRWIEHLITDNGREMVHHLMLDCVAMPDTWAMRHEAATSGCMFHAEEE